MWVVEVQKDLVDLSKHYIHEIDPLVSLDRAECFELEKNTQKQLHSTVEPRFNEVAGDRPNLFVKWRVRYIENLDITNLRGNDQNVRYIEVIVND